MKKTLLIGWLLLIAYFSTTAHLLVLDPSTWFNSYEYNSFGVLKDLLNRDSAFYYRYLENGKTMSDLSMEFYFRKMAHSFFYGSLAILFVINLPWKRMKYIVGVLLTMLVATMDELNQFLIVGRSGRLIDILLDSAAALVVVISYALISRYINKQEN